MTRLADAAAPQTIARAAQELGCRSVAFTYNDPVIFMEYAVDVAQACHEAGIQTVAVTAGYINEEPRADFFAHMDAVNVDLKGFNEDFYRSLCAGHLQPVLETLRYIKHETNAWLEITNLIIPGQNDSDADAGSADGVGRGRAWGPTCRCISPHSILTSRCAMCRARRRRRLTRARQIALANGVRYAYTGNVHDRERRQHLLPSLWQAVDRARLVYVRRVEPDAGWRLLLLWHALRGPF